MVEMTIGTLCVHIIFIGSLKYYIVIYKKMYKKKDRYSEDVVLLNVLKASRRKEEIEAHGKFVSLRPAIFKNKKKYNRKRNYIFFESISSFYFVYYSYK